MRPDADPTGLSLLFHLNSEPWLNDDAYEAATRQHVLESAPPGSARIALPAVEEEAVGALIRRRSSCRAFAPTAMPLEALAALATAAVGIVESIELQGGDRLLRRSVPSAGGLHPLDLYAFTQSVTGLEDGLYRHLALRREFVRVGGAGFESLTEALYAYPFVQSANVVLALVANFARAQRKYGPRGYRYILLEAGHAAQNICLRAVELELGTLCIGGFVDSQINELLGLDVLEAGAVYMVGAGSPLESPP